ncbi:hypothetical protein CA267_007935 [Alteromonas pelagimontana]|uniref:Uncharacterized protein n=1 Tax=Alteromonas pelagimontana TaxID=1858656 RepID=A0A6M4MC36_9ALTE|nr:hypothetical protein [Alteromonas pelagimontana]QJR80713.1 hypothetical protein CA267_007935 [Alteromonas pelagimontana]
MQRTQHQYHEWETEISCGNHYFEKEHLILALVHYKHSLSIAKALFVGAPWWRKAVSALLVSAHNLADYFIYQEGFGLAYAELQSVLRDIETAIQQADPDAPAFEVLLWGKDVALRELRIFEQNFSSLLALSSNPREHRQPLSYSTHQCVKALH